MENFISRRGKFRSVDGLYNGTLIALHVIALDTFIVVCYMITRVLSRPRPSDTYTASQSLQQQQDDCTVKRP